MKLDLDVEALSRTFRTLFREGALDLPIVGRGDTSSRHMALHELGRTDLSLARVAEAHTDAIAILVEAGRTPIEGALYGVWASEGPGSQLALEKKSNGELTLNGSKRYCSGCLFLDAALVTARSDEGVLLLEVPLRTPEISMDATEWVAPAFHATATGSVEFRNVRVTRAQIVGTPGWYLTRPGFWHGALGPASAWAGGAAGLVDVARNAKRPNPHYLAHLGALEAAEWGMRAVLDRAGREIDADPQDATGKGRSRALMARHLIERACTEVLDHFGRATGPALLAYDSKVAQRYAELTLYIRQCHAERDLQALAE